MGGILFQIILEYFSKGAEHEALSPKRIRYLSVDLVVEFKYTCIGGRNAFVKSNGIDVRNHRP